jgi:hypothetical protein
VIDPELMKSGKPKYNNVLRGAFKDANLDSRTTAFVDPYLDTVWKTPTFIHLRPGPNPINLAYRIEVTAILLRFPKLLLSERFMKYSGGLATEESPSDDRDAIIAECIVGAL